jgi:hypothetical protein
MELRDFENLEEMLEFANVFMEHMNRLENVKGKHARCCVNFLLLLSAYYGVLYVTVRNG